MKFGANVAKRDRWLVNKRGQKLYCVSFEPLDKKPFATLFFHHGLAEHISRYDEGVPLTNSEFHLAMQLLAVHAVFTRMSQNGVAVHR